MPQVIPAVAAWISGAVVAIGGGAPTVAIAVPHGVHAATLAHDGSETYVRLGCADRPDGGRSLSAHNITSAATLPEVCVAQHTAGYKALIAQGVTEAGCMAHARRKFFELQEHGQSQIAGEALERIAALYGIEQEARELDAEARQALRQTQAQPLLEDFKTWLLACRGKIPNGSSSAKAIDYTLKRWAALIHYLTDGNVPIDNNWIENQIRPIAIGRNNWLFAGSLRAGQRAAAVMSLIQSAKLNGHDPYHYIKDVLGRLPTQPASRIEELLPHRWTLKTAH